MNPSGLSTQGIVVDQVTKRFRHRPALFNLLGKERTGETIALRDVSFSVEDRSVLALLGPNGSGKTTTLKLISTMLLPDSGSVRVGTSDTRTDPDRVRRAVGFAVATERSFFPRLSGRENLEFFAALEEVPRGERRDRVAGVLEQVGLSDAADTLAMKYSTGMYQRLGIARALVKRPTILLLDEPTRSLDPAAAAHAWDLVRRIADNGATVLLATHSFEEAAAVADGVCVLVNGRAVAHQPLGSTDGRDALRDLYFRATEQRSEEQVGGRV